MLLQIKSIMSCKARISISIGEAQYPTYGEKHISVLLVNIIKFGLQKYFKIITFALILNVKV